MLLPQNNGFESFDQEGSLEQFVISVQTIQSSVEGQMAMDIFDQDPAVEGLWSWRTIPLWALSCAPPFTSEWGLFTVTLFI